MGSRGKVFGLIMAVLMMASSAAIASAQDSTSTTGTAELLPGACTVSVFGIGGSPDFGDWQWNGARYQLSGTNGIHNQAQIRLSIGTPSYGGSCDLNVGAISITNGDSTIGHTYFSATTHPSASSWPRMGADGVTFEDISTNSFTVYVRLLEVPTRVTTGTYQGDITFTVSSGQ